MTADARHDDSASADAAARADDTAGADDAGWIARAVRLAVDNVADGGGPFGAVVVRDGVLLAEGRNRVTATLDPTAHAEVVAIREACRAVGDFALTGATLYTSCEPCPLCLSAALWARIGRIVYAANRDDAADGGFDDREFYELFARPRDQWDVAVDEVRPADARAPFDAWRANKARTDY